MIALFPYFITLFLPFLSSFNVFSLRRSPFLFFLCFLISVRLLSFHSFLPIPQPQALPLLIVFPIRRIVIWFILGKYGSHARSSFHLLHSTDLFLCIPLSLSLPLSLRLSLSLPLSLPPSPSFSIAHDSERVGGNDAQRGGAVSRADHRHAAL